MDKTMVMSFEIFQQECLVSLVSPYHRPAFLFDCDHPLKGLNEFQGDDQIVASDPSLSVHQNRW